MGSSAERFYNMAPIWLQNLLVSTYGYKLYRKRYFGVYNEILELVKESRSWTAEQTEAYQNEHLFRIVRHCRLNIPYYQKLFADYGLHENDFTSTQALSRLPILDKQTLREQQHRFRQPGEKPYMIQHTSGSTGTPLALLVNEHTYKLAMALLVDHEEYHGVPFGSKRATFAGRMIQSSHRMSPPFARMNRAENQKLFSSYHLNEDTFPWYKRDLDRFQPSEIIGYASAISDLASYYQLTNTQPCFRPKAIITNSETLLAWQREKIETTFKAPVFDYYGTAEYIVFSGQNKRGLYKPNPIIGITEVERNSAEEKEGRIVATTLSNTLMPLLRYDLGDTATLGPADKNGSASILAINGRKDDYLETRDGRRIGRIDHIFKGVTGVREGQVIQSEPGSAIIKVVRSVDQPFDQALLIDNAKSRLGKDFDIELNIVDHIPRGPNGKFKSVLKL